MLALRFQQMPGTVDLRINPMERRKIATLRNAIKQHDRADMRLDLFISP
jgi:hypothetical protein